MPNYKYIQFFHKVDSPDFDKLLHPGTLAPYSGIYRCENCGFEASSTAGNPLPPARDCGSHGSRWKCAPGTITWRLVAAAIHTTAA